MLNIKVRDKEDFKRVQLVEMDLYYEDGGHIAGEIVLTCSTGCIFMYEGRFDEDEFDYWGITIYDDEEETEIEPIGKLLYEI